MKAFLLVCLGCFLINLQSLFGQSNKVTNFNRDQFKAGLQNWDFEQDAAGNIYIANNEGLLTFNGTKWQLFPLPNNTIVRAIAFDKNGRLYAGGQDEIGYYEPNAAGKLVYTSLLPLLPIENRQFSDIWEILVIGEDVYFQSFTHIFKLHQQKIVSYPAPAKWNLMGMGQDKLYAYDQNQGMLTYETGTWKATNTSSSLPVGAGITAMVPFKNGSLIATSNMGLYLRSANSLVPFSITGNTALNRLHFTCAQILNNGHILLGTYDNGVIRLDSNGRFVESITIKDGLKNNNVKCIFTDAQQSIWLGLEDGISFIDLNSPIKWLNPAIFNGAQGYGVAKGNSNIYFAMSNGFYQMPIEKKEDWQYPEEGMKKIASGLTWNVTNIQGSILLGGDAGFFEWRDNTLSPIDRSTGYWNFKPIGVDSGKLKVASGTYNGISIFNASQGLYKKENNLKSISSSARYLEYDSLLQAIWISHPYRGIYKISLKDGLPVHYTEAKGLPSTLNNHIFKIDNKIIAATLKGVFAYNIQKDVFELSPTYDTIFKDLSLRYLKKDSVGNLWFVSEKKLGVVQAGTQKFYYFPELDRKMASGFEHIFPLDKEQVVVGGEQGFFLINFFRYISRETKPVVYISGVTARQKYDSLVYGGFGAAKGFIQKNETILSHLWNEIRFEYSSPYCTQSGNLSYSYRLKGLNNDWSDWTHEIEKDYTNLGAGSYTFEVKVRNNLHEESNIAAYTFSIRSPWYSTVWAKLIYGLFFAWILYLIYQQQAKRLKQRHEKKLQEERQRHKEKQQIVAYEHQLALEKSEKEIAQLKNEKLETELAASALNLVQKKEFLHKLKDEIDKAYKNDAEHINPADVRKMLRDLTTDDKLDEDWDQFSVHFNSVHNNFLVLLKNKFPHLTAHDLKLCAYLRLNISSKEMARLMSISIRGVEINRYRLRKKLNLQPKENLFEFLLSIEGSKE